MNNLLTQGIIIFATALFGGFFGAYFQSHFQHQKKLKADILKLKQSRYLSILIQMLTLLDPKRALGRLKRFVEILVA